MIVWSDKLRYGGRMSEGRIVKKIKKRLSSGKPVIGAYLVALASNRDNLFDILDVKELIFPYYKRQRICVVGMTYSKDAAIELTAGHNEIELRYIPRAFVCGCIITALTAIFSRSAITSFLK